MSMGAWVHNRKDVNFTQYLHKPTQISLPSLSLSLSLSLTFFVFLTSQNKILLSRFLPLSKLPRSDLEISPPLTSATMVFLHSSPQRPLRSHLPLFNIALFICFALILATAKPQQSQPPVMVVVYSNDLLPLFFYFLLGLGFGFSLFN